MESDEEAEKKSDGRDGQGKSRAVLSEQVAALCRSFNPFPFSANSTLSSSSFPASLSSTSPPYHPLLTQINTRNILPEVSTFIAYRGAEPTRLLAIPGLTSLNSTPNPPSIFHNNS